MPIFVQLVKCASGGKFGEKKDSEKINETLKRLQDCGAKIISITPAIAGSGLSIAGTGLNAPSAVCVITYEASAQIS